MKLYPPRNYSRVDDYVHRSGYVAEMNAPFVRSLGIDKILILSAEPSKKLPETQTSFRVYESGVDDIVDDLVVTSPKCGQMSDFTLENHNHALKLGPNLSLVDKAVALILQSVKNEKGVLVVCSMGTHLTSIVLGCYRKATYGWALSSIFEEMRRFCGPQPLQEQMVELYGQGRGKRQEHEQEQELKVSPNGHKQE